MGRSSPRQRTCYTDSLTVALDALPREILLQIYEWYFHAVQFEADLDEIEAGSEGALVLNRSLREIGLQAQGRNYVTYDARSTPSFVSRLSVDPDLRCLCTALRWDLRHDSPPDVQAARIPSLLRLLELLPNLKAVDIDLLGSSAGGSEGNRLAGCCLDTMSRSMGQLKSLTVRFCSSSTEGSPWVLTVPLSVRVLALHAMYGAGLPPPPKSWLNLCPPLRCLNLTGPEIDSEWLKSVAESLNGSLRHLYLQASILPPFNQLVVSLGKMLGRLRSFCVLGVLLYLPAPESPFSLQDELSKLLSSLVAVQFLSVPTPPSSFLDFFKGLPPSLRYLILTTNRAHRPWTEPHELASNIDALVTLSRRAALQGCYGILENQRLKDPKDGNNADIQAAVVSLFSVVFESLLTPSSFADGLCSC